MIRTIVVDDDFMAASVHRQFTERVPGFEVVGEATTGAEALELVNSKVVEFSLRDAPGIIAMQTKQGNPVSVWTDVAACGMPIVEHPELIFVADVL